jgi:hypothetical protein
MNRHNPRIEQWKCLLWAHRIQDVSEIVDQVKRVHSNHRLASRSLWTHEWLFQQSKHIHDKVLNVIRQLLLVLILLFFNNTYYLGLGFEHRSAQISQIHLYCRSANLEVDICVHL